MLIEFILLIIAPMCACIILAGIHSYLGMHVVRRGVIFVDLALAQIAALGAITSFFIGYSLDSSMSYWISLGFTLSGAVLLSFIRSSKEIIPQEAIIGIVYVIASAMTIMLLNKSPNGGEELKSILIGQILFVDWSDVIELSILYSFIGVLHWVFRKPLWEITRNSTKATQNLSKTRWYDFIFYASFGVVVTSSVRIGGVLLVFTYLVIPVVCSMLFFNRVFQQLIFAWTLALLCSFIGFVGSYYLDSPPGATIICSFGVVIGICFLLKKLKIFTVFLKI
jgi:zinc/manganese transport system permease protein